MNSTALTSFTLVFKITYTFINQEVKKNFWKFFHYLNVNLWFIKSFIKNYIIEVYQHKPSKIFIYLDQYYIWYITP